MYASVSTIKLGEDDFPLHYFSQTRSEFDPFIYDASSVNGDERKYITMTAAGIQQSLYKSGRSMFSQNL